MTLVPALLLSLASVVCAGAFTPFRVASIFSEHVVLQRAPASSRVWGWTTPQGVVEARLNCSASGGPVFATNVTADSEGLWVVNYPPINGTHVPCYSSFTDLTSLNSVWYLDVVFGEVLLCLGQSNMDLPTSYVINSTEEIAQATHYGPYIRLFALPLQAFSVSPMATPQSDFLAYRPWAQASIESVTVFSAECWLTARNLFEGIKANEGGVGVPVGAIMSDWPGASITQLSSPAALATCNASSSGVATSGVTFPGPIPGPGPLYSQWNTMAAPLTVGGGLAINNFIYHQGEADVHGWYDPGGPPTSEEVYRWYSCRLRALINDFRGTLGNLPTAWFGVSQLNPYAGDCAGLNGCSHVAALRQAQLDVAQTTPYTTASVIPDGGDPWAPAGSVHSRRKQMVASRLVGGALAIRYGADIPYGPRYASFVDASSGGVLKAVVSFTPDSVQGGLELQLGVNGTSWCPLNASATAPTLNECGWWSVKGSSSGWVNATTALIGSDGVSFELSAPIPGGGSDTVVATAGLWNSYPVATLYSARTQLPVIPWNSSFLAK